MSHLNQIRIEEKFSRFWPAFAILSVGIALIFFLLYIRTDHVLYEGYFRLIAFVSFAAGLLSYFKLRDGKMVLLMERTDDGDLRIRYELKNKVIQEDAWSLKEIDSVKVDEMPNTSLYNDIVTGDRCVMIQLKNNKGMFYLNSLNNRVIPLNEADAEKIRQFVQSGLETRDSR